MKKLIIISTLFILNACSTQPQANKQQIIQLSHEELQKKWMEISTPSKSHEVLNEIVGTWTVESKFWTSPDSAPEVSKGSSKNTLVFGNRFLKQEYKAKSLGQDFYGVGYLGFNNGTKKYESNWMDNMNTSISYSTGSFCPKKRVLVLHGKGLCPASGETMYSREVITFKDKNHYSLEMFVHAANQPEMKALDLQYSR
jgi:hypothetical protein